MLLKRILASALTTLITLALFAPPSIAAQSAFSLGITGGGEISPGGSAAFTVTLSSVSDADGILGGDVYLSYDTALLSFVGAELVSSPSDGWTAELYGDENGTLHIGFYDDKLTTPVMPGGSASFRVVFAAASSASGKTASVSVSDCDFLTGAYEKTAAGFFGSAATLRIGKDKTDDGTVDIVIITDLDEPSDGAVLDKTAQSETIGIEITSVKWTPDADAFEEEQLYTVIVSLQAVGGYEFSDGATVSIDGYLATLERVSEVSAVASYTFKSTAESVWTNPFTDVAASDSFYEAVRYVNMRSLFLGVSETEFAPEAIMTRAMFVTVLGRLADVDTSLYVKSGFDDVPEGQWYSPYVAWAANSGIVMGYNPRQFGLDDKITVEQAAAILYRYADFMKRDVSESSALTECSDCADISSWALTSVKWAVGSGVYAVDGGKLEPRADASRALVAKLFYGYAENFGERS